MGQALKQDADIRKLSLDEFAEHFQSVLKEKQDLSVRLDKAREELATMIRARAEFDREQIQLNAEIEKLRDELKDLTKKKESPKEDDSRTDYLVAKREKLIRDEFERKYQELKVQVQTQKKKYTQEVDALKKRLNNCMCQTTVWK